MPFSQVNIQPATRKARQAQLFREDLEKMRLKARRENYCHYEEGGLVQPPESLGYISEADRFITDIAGVQKTERDAEVRKREQQHYNKRIERAQKEEQRWGQIELQHNMEQQRMDDMRDNYSYARSNKTSMPYNPINLRYDDGADGDRLRYSDEACDTAARSAPTTCSGMTSTGYNPITGAPISRVHVPDAPSPPMAENRAPYASRAPPMEGGEEGRAARLSVASVRAVGRSGHVLPCRVRPLLVHPAPTAAVRGAADGASGAHAPGGERRDRVARPTMSNHRRRCERPYAFSEILCEFPSVSVVSRTSHFSRTSRKNKTER